MMEEDIEDIEKLSDIENSFSGGDGCVLLLLLLGLFYNDRQDFEKEFSNEIVRESDDYV